MHFKYQPCAKHCVSVSFDSGFYFNNNAKIIIVIIPLMEFLRYM